MKFYELAIRYLTRKKSKTFILLCVFLFVNSLILSMTIILRATNEAQISMKEKSGSKVVAEIQNPNEMITEKEIEQILLLEEVISVNRLANNEAFPVNFMPITGNAAEDENNWKVSIFSYDNLQQDSAFSEQKYRLLDGNFLRENTDEGVVINPLLAEANGLKIGDEIELVAECGRVSVKIVGVFLAGRERKQDDAMAAISRIENRIFMDNHSYRVLFGDVGFYKIAVYTKNPEQIEDLQTKLYSIFQDKVSLTTSDSLFQQMKAPLEQIEKVTNLLRILTILAGTVVIALLLCMWMRSRQKETAILISLGKTKLHLFLQILLESAIVFGFAFIGACGTGGLMAKVLQAILIDSRSTEVVLKVLVQKEDVLSLLIVGSLIVLFTVTCSLFPILKANPKDILSKMEG